MGSYSISESVGGGDDTSFGDVLDIAACHMRHIMGLCESLCDVNKHYILDALSISS